MRLYVYQDKRSPYPWAPGLIAAADYRSGIDVRPVDADDCLTSDAKGYFFGRCEQRAEHLQRARDFCVYTALLPDVRSVIAPREYLHYERKDLQAAAFGHWMPATWCCENVTQAARALGALGVPLISKSAQGSSSSNVRLLKTRDEAMAEAAAAFGEGLPTPRGLQKGYVLWQRYLAGNDYAYRVVRVGNWYWVLCVYNRDDKPFASGSGKFRAITADNFGGEERSVLQWAHEFCEYHGMRWVGLDIVRDHLTGEWQLLETTLAWNLRAKGANEACAVMDEYGAPHPNGYHGRDQWQLLLDEIANGAFG